MRNIIENLNFTMMVIMTAAYFYHAVYIAVGFFRRKRATPAACAAPHRFAALICARNESAVIGQLIESLKKQDYPSDMLDIYVLADNCTDNTAAVATAAGAMVHIRRDSEHVGKGYALNFLLHTINDSLGWKHYDGYFVFDADNIVDPGFVREMNSTFSQGYSVLTSYRNSKNFASNWLTYGYAVWFLFEARFINFPRMLLKSGCAVSGTGFLVSSGVIDANGGWPFHLLTEDIEFSVNCAISGVRIGYCDKAVVYDEQPETFTQSWRQRLRWSRGFYQIDMKYLGRLIRGVFKPKGSRMTCYDMLMTVAPCMLLSIGTGIINTMAFVMCLTMPAAETGLLLTDMLVLFALTMLLGYVGTIFMGALTIFTEWKNIRAPARRKLMYLPLFPLFLATYIPIALAALVCRVSWKPIQHFASTGAPLATSRGGRYSAGN